MTDGLSPKARPTSPVSTATSAVIGVVTIVALILAVILANPGSLSATGDSASADATASPSSIAPTGETTRVTVRVEGMSFTPNTIEAPAGNRLIITVENSDDQRHDLVLATGPTSGSIAPGASATVDAGIITEQVDGWCSIPGHRQAGMTLTIRPLTSTAENTADSEGDSQSEHSSMSHSSSSALSSPTMDELLDYAETVEARTPVLAPASAERVHEVTFTVTEETVAVTDSLTREAWTFNGTGPGPTLRGRIGDTFRITLVNEGTMSHSIDFHAGLVSPDENMRSIEPGESLEYVFEAKNAGIWLYHCSTAPMSMHIANGMFGAVVIDPSDLDPVDSEYVLIASELYLGGDGEVADAAKLAAMTPDVMSFNGLAFQYAAHPISAKVGERIRVWVLDAGPNLPLSFHVVGTQFDTVWREGDYEIRGGGEGGGAAQVLSLHAAEGGFVEFTPLEAGRYSFVNHAMSLAEKGEQGAFLVTE